MGGEGSELEILGTLQLDTGLDGIKAKQRFYICGNPFPSALFEMGILRWPNTVLARASADAI